MVDERGRTLVLYTCLHCYIIMDVGRVECGGIATDKRRYGNEASENIFRSS